MNRIGLLAASSVVALALGNVSAWATPPENTYFVDPSKGTDSSTCGAASLASAATGPCATLNQALQNNTTSGSITITSPGAFGPIYLNSNISIQSLNNVKTTITADGTAPGCIGAAPGTCAAASASEAAITINDSNTGDVIKLKGLIANAGSAGVAAVQITNVANLSLQDMALRGGPGSNNNLVAMLYDTSSVVGGGNVHQVYIHNLDAGFANVGGALYFLPTVPSSIHISNAEIHHAKFGVKINTSGVSSGNSSVVLDTVSMFSFNTNALTNINTGSTFAGMNLARSSISQTGGAGLVVSGAGAYGTLYEDVITQCTIGIQILGGTVFTSGNNLIFFNSTNLTGGSLSTPAPAGLGSPTQ